MSEPSLSPILMKALLFALLHPFVRYAAAEARREARQKVVAARDDIDRLRARIHETRRLGSTHHPHEIHHLTAQLLDRLGDLTYWANAARHPIAS